MLCQFLATLVLLLPVRDEEQLAISSLRNAYESHINKCKSGQMNFTWSNLHIPNNDHFRLKGFVEWADGYLYFKGNMRHERPGPKGRETLDQDIRVLFSGGYELKLASAAEANRVKFVRLDICNGQQNKMAKWRPDPFLYLVRGGPLEGLTSPLNLLQATPVTLGSAVQFERRVETMAAVVQLHTEFSTDSATHVFDLAKGGLCSELHLVRHRNDGDYYINATRNWVRVSGDTWCPENSKVVCSDDKDGKNPIRVVECRIDSFEPIGRREFSGPATLASFGAIPKGANVSQRFSNGTIKEWIEGVDGEEDVELELREHAEKIVEGSFMDDQQ